MENLKINLLNINIDNLTSLDIQNKVEDLISQKKPIHIVGVNIDQVLKVKENKYSQKIFDDAALIFTDGKPILWMSKILGKPLIERITGPDLMLKLCELASVKKYRLFLLGSAPGVADRAAINLKKMFNKIEVIGTYSPPFGFENDKLEMKKINDMLLNSKADMLFVGMGSPKQDIFIYENKDIYKIPVSFSIGAALDFIGDKTKRAPRWMINVGLEWFYRILKDPKRLFKRYFHDIMKIIPFFLHEFKQVKLLKQEKLFK